jgi:hypothetical protein
MGTISLYLFLMINCSFDIMSENYGEEMNKIFKSISLISSTLLFVGCVSTQSPKPANRPHYGTPIQTAEYGLPPVNYRTTIKNYFANKIKRPQMASFVFSKPQRAYKRSGLAYGGDIVWRGWLVDVSIATQSRSGRLQSPKPYMVLFNGSTIVEDILGSHHQLITRVGE